MCIIPTKPKIKVESVYVNFTCKVWLTTRALYYYQSLCLSQRCYFVIVQVIYKHAKELDTINNEHYYR